VLAAIEYVLEQAGALVIWPGERPA
jgi:hypothetical protein